MYHAQGVVKSITERAACVGQVPIRDCATAPHQLERADSVRNTQRPMIVPSPTASGETQSLRQPSLPSKPPVQTRMSASSTNDSVAECYEERQIIKKSDGSTNPAHTDTIITLPPLSPRPRHHGLYHVKFRPMGMESHCSASPTIVTSFTNAWSPKRNGMVCHMHIRNQMTIETSWEGTSLLQGERGDSMV